jgi:uncharacterized protein (TIGR01244 family)
MRGTVLAALALVSLGLLGCIGNGTGEAVTTLLADPADVIAAGSVVPVDGVTSSGQPDEAALEVYARSGYAAVIDIRTAKEPRGMDDERAVVEGLGMDYVLLPIRGSDGITFENAAALDKLIDSYDAPVLVHCGSGNRVGALLALAKASEGMDDEQALEYGREAGMTRLEGAVRKALDDD